MTAFRTGDFSARLPSKWTGIPGQIAAAFNEVLVMNERRANEVARVSRMAGKEGLLRQRLAPTGMVGGWAQEVEALNALMDELVRPITDLTRTIEAVAQGEIGQPTAIEGTWKELKDCLTIPVHSAALHSRVNVFVELFRKTRALEALNERLEAQNAGLQREAGERTRRIEAESARAKAEAENAAKDRFLAMLSHELRTPLTPILYAVELLECDEECPPQIRGPIAAIRRNVRLEARLIDDLLDLARIRSGKFTLEAAPLDVRNVLREAIEICRAEFAQRRVELREEFGASGTLVLADSARLQQVFWNLLMNAGKFTPAGGLITVRTSNPSGNRWQVEITDTGVGIEPDKLERIFDAFEQGTSVTGSAGLGLGLAICKALIEMQGGTVTAHSAGAGRGATFLVELPLHAPLKIEKKVQEREPVPPVKRRLLLVEDHGDTAEMLRRLLALQGYEVRTASSIASAIEMTGTYKFDILISDIGLPDGRGTELLARLREQLGGACRAIAMSGFGMQDDLDRSLKAGFSEHLTKPVEFSALLRAIDRHAGTGQLPSP